MDDSQGSILLVEQHDHVVYLTLNRPSVLNALNRELLIEIKDELERIKNNSKIQAVVFTGSGTKSFSAGADIQFLNQASPMEVRELAQLAVSVAQLIENSDKISLALINGFALGGGLELAEACTFRIAVNSAKLGHPEVKIGAVAGWGGTTRLPRLIGKSRATEMLLTGKIIDAREALAIGLIHRVVDAKDLFTEGEKLLRNILSNAPIAVSLTWQAIQRGLDLPINESTKLGADLFGLAASTHDFRDGTDAFLNKQKPQFIGE